MALMEGSESRELRRNIDGDDAQILLVRDEFGQALFHLPLSWQSVVWLAQFREYVRRDVFLVQC